MDLARCYVQFSIYLAASHGVVWSHENWHQLHENYHGNVPHGNTISKSTSSRTKVIRKVVFFLFNFFHLWLFFFLLYFFFLLILSYLLVLFHRCWTLHCLMPVGGKLLKMWPTTCLKTIRQCGAPLLNMDG